MAGKGGKIPGAGRKAGIPNVATRTMKERAARYGTKALKKLVQLVDSPEESIALKAANDLLDRGYGKAVQAHDLNMRLLDPLKVKD